MKKKILSLILAATLCFGASLTAFATESGTAGNATQQGTTNTVKTIEEAENVQHTYYAYQILTFDKQADGTYTNVQWGASAGSNVQMAFFMNVTDENDNAITTGQPKDYAIQLGDKYGSRTYDNLTDFMEQFAAILATNVDANGKFKVNDDKTITGAPTGWYLIVDETTALDTDEFKMYKDRAQLQVFEEGSTVTINEKRTVVELKKEVADINDSKVTVVDAWGKSADYDVKDAVPFKITSTVPSNVTQYRTFDFTIDDDQEPGFNSATGFEVTVDGKALVEGTHYTVVNDLDLSEKKDGANNDFQIVFKDLRGDDLKDIVKDGSKIVVTYTSVLNDKAKLGFDPNTNKSRVTFNPNNTGIGYTPWDIAIVFSYEPVINKTDGVKPLVGAKFSLDKVIAGQTTLKNIIKWESGSESTFVADGIDDGIYCITELEAPKGYNKVVPIYFEVVADHGEKNNSKVLEKLTVYEITAEEVKDENGNVVDMKYTRGNVLGWVDKDGKSEGTWTMSKAVVIDTDKHVGNMNATIINQEGVVLPSTGGIGTTIFYVVGGVLVAAAVVLLVVRRRMRTEEE